jgi:hypothetical protein
VPAAQVQLSGSRSLSQIRFSEGSLSSKSKEIPGAAASAKPVTLATDLPPSHAGISQKFPHNKLQLVCRGPENFSRQETMRVMNAVASTTLQEQSEFDARFSRCHGLLYFLARRVLGRHELAEDAVQNCRLAASRNSLALEHAGVLRSWLLRILIDEVSLILNRTKKEDAYLRQPMDRPAATAASRAPGENS